MLHHLIRNIFIAGLLFVLSGCLLTSQSYSKESGVRVGTETLRQVQPGQTTEDWLVAALGEPTSRSVIRGPGSAVLLGYNHQTVRKSRGAVFLLFNGRSEKVDNSTTYFEVIDGVVTRYWTES